MALVVKNTPANTGDPRDAGSILGSGRSPGVGNGNPLQYSCLENYMDREARQVTVFRKPRVIQASQVMLVVKSQPVNAGNVRDMGSVSGLGRSLGGGHGNPLQYSCLENPMDREAWRAIVHRVAQG